VDLAVPIILKIFTDNIWKRTIFALPEEDILLVCEEVGQSDSISAEMIGDRPYFIFQDGEKITRYFSM
jgi:hypothetical protein